MTRLDEKLTKMTQYELGNEAYSLLDKYVEVGIRDWRGHFKRGTACLPQDRLRSSLAVALLMVEREDELKEFLEALKNGAPFDKPVPVPYYYSRDLRCPFCGEDLRLGFDGEGFVVLNDPCEHPDGIVTEWELNVPSGKLVVDNDLRRWFPVDEDSDFEGVIGLHRASMASAKVGMSFGFVGNTCPSVYRRGEDDFVVGVYRDEIYVEDDNGNGRELPNPVPCPWGEEVAGITTDLWWYCMADYDDLAARVAHYTPDEDFKTIVDSVIAVDVRPGVYRFHHNLNVNRDAPTVEFSTFEWVREPDPFRDLLKEEREKNYSAAEVLIQHAISWPTLYMDVDSGSGDRSFKTAVERWENFTDKEKARSLASAADQTMCVIGGGIEWHENGFPRTVVSDEAKRFAAELGEIPPFDFQGGWYPISAGYGGLCRGAGVMGEGSFYQDPLHLSDDFVKLGLNICQSAIKFGEKPRLNLDTYPPTYEVPSARERMQLFVDCYRGFRERFPHVVFDAEFDAWMNETDLKEYIANFDFGPDHPPEDEWGPPPSTTKKAAKKHA